jgi:hypothetical protein
MMAKQKWFFLMLLVLLLVPVPLLGQSDNLINDFEGSDSTGYWDLWIPDDSIQAECTLDQPGYESDHSLRLTFDIGLDEVMVCGRGDFENVADLVNSTGLSFYWRADRAGADIIVEVAVEDPSQEDPAAEGHSSFRAPTQQIPADTDDKASRWARAIIPWDTFSKVAWETSGTHTFNPVDLAWLGLLVDQPRVGTIWIDNIELIYEPLSAPTPNLAAVNDYLIQWG